MQALEWQVELLSQDMHPSGQAEHYFCSSKKVYSPHNVHPSSSHTLQFLEHA